MNKSLLVFATLLAGSMFVTSAQAQADGPTGQKSDELVTLSLATPDELESLGLVIVGNANCSASLLTNEWVVSAAHCFTPGQVAMPGNIQLTAGWDPLQGRNPDRVYRYWGVAKQDDTADIALLHVPNAFSVNGSTTAFRAEISTLSLLDMKGQEVKVFGAGINVLAKTDDKGNDIRSSGDGRFRTARFKVNQIVEGRFWYPTNDGKETIAGGDSGGPSYEFTTGRARLAGVHSLCSTKCLRPDICTEDDPWKFISELSACADAPISSAEAALRDIMRQFWNPAAAIQTVRVAHSEGEVARSLLLGEIDALPWSYARRAAQRYCENRGFVAGYADGAHQPGESYEFKCFGNGAGGKFDAMPDHLVRLSDKFAHVADLNWAQAARAATAVCKMIDVKFVAGVLTGFELISEPGPAVNQRAGVFCLNAANAKSFDVPLVRLNSPGTDVDSLAFMSWAAAGRAASKYCRSQLFTMGGFFNGTEYGDKRGVTCIGKNSASGDSITEDDLREPELANKIEIGSGVENSVEPAPRAQATEKTTLMRELDALAGRGAGLAAQDPLSAELRNRAAEGAARRGFDIGMAAAEGQTQDGPGKQRIRAALSTAEREGYDVALSFSLQRNANAARAATGAAIAIADRVVGRARIREPDVFYWLGFDISSGIFGDPARGAQGNTAAGPGSLAVRNALSPAAQRGFNASMALHLSRKYR
jgi:hypothetical protein